MVGETAYILLHEGITQASPKRGVREASSHRPELQAQKLFLPPLIILNIHICEFIYTNLKTKQRSARLLARQEAMR